MIDSEVIRENCLKKARKNLDFKIMDGFCDITTKRHINLLDKPVSLPTVTDQDWKDIEVDFITFFCEKS